MPDNYIGDPEYIQEGILPDVDDEVFDDCPVASSSFVITDDGLADWAIRKIAEARAEYDRMEAHFTHQLELVRRRTERTEGFMSAKLSEYFDTVPYRVTKTMQRYKLASGELIRKAQAPEFKKDDAILCEFLIENEMDKFVIQTPKPDWSNLKKLCIVTEDGSIVEESTGLVIEGVIAIQRPDKFEVKLNA